MISITSITHLAMAKILEHFEQNVFGINYNLPKMDIVAVRSYEGGAMENEGMMTFTKNLVVNSGHSGNENEDMESTDQFGKDGIMAHELVCQI